MLKPFLASFNFNDFQDNVVSWIVSAYTTYLTESMVWTSIFAGVIFLTYGISKSASSVVAMSLLVFGLFGTSNYFLQAPEYNFLFSIIAAAGFAGGIMALFMKRYG